MVIQAKQQAALDKYKKLQHNAMAQSEIRINDFLPSSSPNSPHKRTSNVPKKKWNSTPTDGNGRVNEWLGAQNKAKRSWTAKEIKSPEQMAREQAEGSDDETKVSQKVASVVLPDLDSSESEDEESVEVYVEEEVFSEEEVSVEVSVEEEVVTEEEVVEENQENQVVMEEFTICSELEFDDMETVVTALTQRGAEDMPLTTKPPPSFLVVKGEQHSLIEEASVPSLFANSVCSKTLVSAHLKTKVLAPPKKYGQSVVKKPIDANFASVPSLFQSAVKKTPDPLKIYRKAPAPSAASHATSVVEPSSDPCCSSSRLVHKPPAEDLEVESSATTIELRPEEFIINTEDTLVKSYLNAKTNVDSDDDSDSVADDADYHQKMKAKLASFMKDNDLDSEDGDQADDESEVKRERRPANVPEELADNQLDHVILACSNLVDGMKQFEQMTGLKPTKIGSLRGVGTKSARVNLSNNTFIEIIGPDDTKTSSEGIGSELLDLAHGKLIPYHYAVRSPPNDVKIPGYLGWDRDSIIMVHVDPEDFDDNGETHLWDLLLLYGHGLGGVIPAFVNWKEKRFHPTARLEQKGAKLNYVQVRVPEGNYAHDLLDGVEGITVVEGEPTLTISIDTPKGEVTFSTIRPEGIQMPGFGDANHPSLHMPAPGKPKLLPVSKRTEAL